MKNHRRITLLGMCALFGASGITVAACSGDDTTGAATDSGTGSDATTDVQTSDVVSHPDAGDAGALRGNVYAFNDLVTKISPVRYCFATSATGEPSLSDGVDMMPQPADPAGLAPATGARIDAPPDLIGNNVKVFAYYTQSLDAFGMSGSSCKDLLAASVLKAQAVDGGDAGDAGTTIPDSGGGAVLIQTVDFDAYTMDPGSFSSTARTFLYTAGCPASSDSSKLALQSASGNTYCGHSPELPGLGDFHVYGFQADSTAASTGTNNRLQVIMGLTFSEYLFPGVEYYFDVQFDGDADVPIYGPVPNDIQDDGGGGFQYVDASGAVQPVPGTESPSLASATSFNWNADVGLSDNYDLQKTLTLSGMSASDLKPGQSYTLLLAGSFYEDPTLGDGGVNPLTIGVRILPNQ